MTTKQALKHYFGYDAFRGRQEDVVNNILAGKNTFVIMPTGAGKSLCYQLPAVMLEGTALVISPLIALMKNQVDQLHGFGIEAGFLNSSMSRSEYDAVKQSVLDGNTKLLYVAPESLVKLEFIDFLHQANISFVAVDEAHCISEWGHDFRPEYRRIREMISQLGEHVPVVALTATATPKVRLDILHNLHIDGAEVIITSFNRPNLYYEIRPKGNGKDTTTEIIKYVKQNQGKSGIIYCLSRRKVEEISEILTVNGIAAVPYHAGLDSAKRNKHQDMFLNEDVQIVVATIAFGMGIDKPDVRYVIHYDVPKSIESYYQETGRAGRDGLEGNCLLFYDFNDIIKLEKFMKDKSVSERESGKLLLQEMAAFCESGACRRKLMLHYFGENFDETSCNNTKMCDNCRHPKTKYQAREDVLLGLQAVEQSKEQFGIAHIINIVRGTNNQQVSINEHFKLPAFAKGETKDAKEWKSIMAQMMVHDFLEKDIQDYGVIKLSDKGRAFLVNPHDIELFKYEDIDRSNVRPTDGEGGSEDFHTYDVTLFNQLVKLRKEIGQQKRIPPYVIFQDPTLQDMATKYPVNTEEFQNVLGVGRGKALKFGQPFINLIREYVTENDIERPQEVVVKSAARKSMAKLFIIQHVDRKTPLDEIAQMKDMTFEELLDNIDQIVYSGTRLNIDYYIDDIIDPEKSDEAHEYFMKSETDDLETAEKALGGDFTRDEIRLIRAKFISEVGN